MYMHTPLLALPASTADHSPLERSIAHVTPVCGAGARGHCPSSSGLTVPCRVVDKRAVCRFPLTVRSLSRWRWRVLLATAAAQYYLYCIAYSLPASFFCLVCFALLLVCYCYCCRCRCPIKIRSVVRPFWYGGGGGFVTVMTTTGCVFGVYMR